MWSICNMNQSARPCTAMARGPHAPTVRRRGQRRDQQDPQIGGERAPLHAGAQESPARPGQRERPQPRRRANLWIGGCDVYKPRPRRNVGRADKPAGADRDQPLQRAGQQRRNRHLAEQTPAAVLLQERSMSSHGSHPVPRRPTTWLRWPYRPTAPTPATRRRRTS